MYNDDASCQASCQSSVAVSKANNAIDNARRAAASSRSRPRRSTSGSTTPQSEYSSNIHTNTNEGLTDDDNRQFVLIATLITERLLPKLDASPGCTHFTLTYEDTAFFQKMLPYSVRRSFVDALRYRLQLLKSADPRVNVDSPQGKLTMQCQLLGLERDKLNVLLDLSQSAGMSYPINFKGQGLVAYGSHDEADQYSNNIQFNINKQYSAGTLGTQTASSRFATYPQIGIDENRTTPSTDWETSAESLARQQIMAEINETKFLMRGSVTSDAVNFWKKHLEELNQRLVALNAEEEHKAVTNSKAVVMGGASTVVPAVEHDADYNLDRYTKVNIPYEQLPPPPENSISTNPLSQGNQMMQWNHAMQETALPQSPLTSPKKTPLTSPKKPLDELPVCDVVAPSDLPGGYMFEAQLGAKKFLATVPPGGVAKGQQFVSTMRELETIEIPVPLGAWRDGSVDFFGYGLCHPLFLNTLFFPCIALGQIMTRTGLDWRGSPANKLVSSLSCTNMTVFLTFWLAINVSAAVMLRISWDRIHVVLVEYWMPVIFFNAFFLMYLMYLTKSVRESIRNKYQIPEENCEGIEDCLCATFCMPCAICQMGRHTADFDTYRATCCTATGLPRQVELAPVTFYEDQYKTLDDGNSHVV